MEEEEEEVMVEYGEGKGGGEGIKGELLGEHGGGESRRNERQ